MYPLVLFVHLLVLVLAFFCMGLAMSALGRISAARTVADARGEIALAERVGRLMPLATVLLLATGAYLTQSRWDWRTPWIDVSIAGLVLVTAIGGGVLGPRERALHRALTGAQEGPLPHALLEQIHDPVLIGANAVNAALVCAVMFAMVVKPGFAGGIAALLLGGGLGALVAAPNLRVARGVRRARVET